jgi:hypothetical protein
VKVICANKIVQKPSGINIFKNNADNDAPRITSVVARGRKTNKLVVPRPLYLCLMRAKEIIVPIIVEIMVTNKPIFILVTKALKYSGA